MIRFLDMSGEEVVWRDGPEPSRKQRLPEYWERPALQLQLVQSAPVTAAPQLVQRRVPRFRR